MSKEDKQEKPVETSPFIVGVGSSAGGIEALIHLVSGLPKDVNASLIIAQHLSPSHKSQMAEILSRETDFDVVEIKNRCSVKPNCVYIGPPGNHILYKDGVLLLEKTPSDVSPKPSVNILFESLADELGDHAIGIVLSGTGSDGTRGLKAIKAAGGFAMVQDLETAKYDGMPRSAIETVDVDKILSPDEMGQEIAAITNAVAKSLFPRTDDDRNELMNELYSRIREVTKIDFSFYKESTLLRRVNRRLLATHTSTLHEYLDYLNNNPEEITALAKELLISVTDFFRDKEAFKALEECVRKIIEKKKKGDTARVWVAGCATGEEAYSIAILFLEEIEKQGKEVALQLFGTDIDDHALNVARKGAYSTHAVTAVNKSLLERYFYFKDDTYQPKKSIRECITFSRQDITRDPPFLHLDMVSFRNVMIYFNTDLQQRVLSLFRYSLLDDGILFLGKSESTGVKEELFVAIDRRSRIFRVSEGSKRPSIPKMLKNNLTTQRAKASGGNTYERLFNEAVLEEFGPCCLVNGRFTILHSRGQLKRFVNFPDGIPELNLSKLIIPEFSAELISAMNKAKRERDPVISRSRYLDNDHTQLWQIVVYPVGDKDNDLFLVNFRISADKVEKVTAEQAEGEQTDKADVAELIAAREQLQTLTEEMAASAEEMQALNEEVQAANEELQANNEELEATNEELQATNEELISVNEESMKKSAELSSINSELESVYNTMDFPIFVFDTELELTRSNDSANRKYHLNTGSLGKEIQELNLPAYFLDVEDKLEETIQTGVKTNIIIRPNNRETFNVFITPVLNSKGAITGAILVIINNSELVNAHEKIEKNQQQLLDIMNNSLAVVALKDNAGRYEFVNKRFEEIFGLDSVDVIGRTDKQLFDEHTAKLLRERDLDTMRSLMPLTTIDELPVNGGDIVLESVRFPILDEEGTIKSICTQANDITRARHANEQLRLAGKLFDRAGEAILVTDHNEVILTSNSAFSDFTGFALEDVVGKTPRILKSGEHSDEFYATMLETLNEKGYWQGEIVNRRKDGEKMPMWLTINVVRDANGDHVNYVATYSDVGEIKSVQRKIEFLATHDELTKLPNRSVLLERLELMVKSAQRQESLCAVLFFDLDDFKATNDSLGHDIGDLLLKQVTKRLQKCVRDTDLLARMGGDEFVAVLSAGDIEEVEQVAKRIVQQVNAPFEIREHTLHVTCSIGISVYPDDGADNYTLLRNADTAMYRSKELGRNQYQYFTEEMKNDADKRLNIEKGVRRALDDHEFQVVYQPQIEVHTGAIIGAEALLRSNHGELEDVPADVFINVAERGRLIDAVGTRATELVLQSVSQWQKSGIDVPRISINVSPRQLKNKDFVEEFRAQLDHYKIAPECIKIEITESALIERIDSISEMLRELKALGVGISIDDFGVGHSSLSYLRKLPIEELKIDRSFITDIVQEEDDRALARTIIKMGQALDLDVVAEGVENDEQFEVLKEEGCSIVQGFNFHKPLSAEDFEKLIRGDK